MNELHELKERLIDELKDYGRKEMTSGTVQMIDTLAHAAKNVCKIIESDDGYSGRYSYRRDSMGRYSRDGLADKLHELMKDAPDEKTRQDIQRLIDRM